MPVDGAELRAIYGYHNASVEVTGCTVARTRSRDSAAIQIDAMRPCDTATLTLSATSCEDNAGGDLCVAGNVGLHVVGCGDLVERAWDSSTVPRPHRARQANHVLQDMDHDIH